MNKERFFLCFGLPKSGTTFLQRMLNMHPEVSCPSEQYLNVIIENLEEFVPKYNHVLATIDRRTGGQGAPVIGNKATRAIFRDTVLNLSREFAGEKPVHGLNDNAVFGKPKFFDDVFEQPKMICIFRNPVDTSISAWRHNHRLAKEETDVAEQHLKLLSNPEGNLEGYVKLRAKLFVNLIDEHRSYTHGRSNFFTLRYENLVNDKKNELRHLFDFLDVDTPEVVLDDISERSTRKNLAANSTHPAFFGVDEHDGKSLAVSRQVRVEALESCSDTLEKLGYDMTALLDDNRDVDGDN